MPGALVHASRLEFQVRRHYPPLMILIDPDQFSWSHSVAVPAIFTTLGAVLGFAASQVRDELKARRDRNAFLRAIGMELDALSAQLAHSLREVTGSAERIKGGGIAPQFAVTFRTSVFSSQLSKLREVDDPLLIKVIHFYSDLGSIQHLIEIVNNDAAEYNGAEAFQGTKERIRPRVQSELFQLQVGLTGFTNRLIHLRAELPPAEQPQ